jgi:hypothetical protein
MTMLERLPIAFALCLWVGCGEGVHSDPGNVEGDTETPDAGDGDDDEADADVDTPSCSADGTRVVLEGAFTASSTDAVTIHHEGHLIGVAGTQAGGDDFIFRRAGDAADGDIEAIATFDVSQYPHNFHYISGPDGPDCEFVPEGTCDGIYALAGSFTVTQLVPTFEASFVFTELADGEGEDPGEAIAGEVTGCISIPNE